MIDRGVEVLLREALMASIFAAPMDPGLSYEELMEVGRRAGHRDGTINDALQQIPYTYRERNRLMPVETDVMHAKSFLPEGPELHDFDALDFVASAVNERIDDEGIRAARIDRSVLVERAKASGLNASAVQGAITFMVLSEILAESGGILQPTQIMGRLTLPGELNRKWRGGPNPHRVFPKPQRQAAVDYVRDVVARRTDGRPRHADPLDAFPDVLERIGLKPFRMWWAQTVTELRASDLNSAPVSCVVLSAALAEGALTFAAKHARDRLLGTFQSSNFDREPKDWRAEKLIESAATGAVPILTAPIRARAEHLHRTRQRVHAGRMLGEYPAGPPDLRPEEGRDAKATAEQVVRGVLDWLERQPTA
ncbi:hypothetical protein MRA01_62620 [Methylobacterium radiotolerans]|nr:hypothetical protein MRA01_62620 [Methylobacterium radiotolerans]